MRSARLAAHRIAHGLGQLAGAARCRSHPEHAANRVGILGRKHPDADRRLIFLEHGDRNDLAIVGKRGVRMRHLEQRCRQPIAISHGGLLDRPPGFPGTQAARHGAGKLDLRLLSVAQGNIGVPHFVGRHFLGDFQSAHVAGLLDHALDGQCAVIVGVTDGEAADTEAAGTGFNQGLRLDAPGLQCHGDRDRLHRRTGLEGVGHGPVAQLLAGQVLALVGNIAWVIGQRQHLAGDRVDHHDAAGLGLARNHRIAQLLISKKLHLAVNAELDVLAVHGRNLLANAFDHAAQPVLDDTPRTRLARQRLVEGQFDAFLSLVFHIGEANDVGDGFAFGVLALVFLALVNAGNAEFADFSGNGFFHLALDPDEGLVLVAELLFQLGQRHFQQPGQFGQLGGTGLDVFRNGPDAGGRHAGSQDQPVAVQDAATVGGQFQRPCKPHLALALKKCVGVHLDIGRPDRKTRERQRDQGHDELAAPDRGLAGQQRAGGVEDVFSTHAAPSGRQRPLHRLRTCT